MADKTQVNVGLPDGKTVKFTLDEEARGAFFGLNVGDEFSGDLLGSDYGDYKLLITGGSDDDGTPLRRDIEGSERRRILFGKRTVGYTLKKSKVSATDKKIINLRSGTRLRKAVRGKEINDTTAQINVKVIEAGSKAME